MTGVGDRIKEARIKKSLTLKDVYRETGVSAGALSDIENNKKLPSAATLLALSSLLDVSTDWILKGELLRGDESPVGEKKDPSVSLQEMEILKALRDLPEEDQEEIRMLIHMKHERFTKKKEAGERSSSYVPGSEESAAKYRMA